MHASTNEAARTGLDPTPALYSFNADHSTLPELNILNRWDWADVKVESSTYAEAKALVLGCHVTQWTAFVGKRETVAEYKQAIIDHVRALPPETYCCHRAGQTNVPPSVLSTWLGRESDRSWSHAVDVVQEGVRKYRHKARIAVNSPGSHEGACPDLDADAGTLSGPPRLR